MTESVLKSIMRLFAIIANMRSSGHYTEDNSHFNHAREVTEAFLGQLVNPDKFSKALQMFDFHYKNLQKKKNVAPIKKISLFSVKTLLICEQINSFLDLEQRIFVILQLLDILKGEDGIITDDAADYINTVADSLKINAEDFDLIYLFVFGTIKNKARNNEFLVISGEKGDKSIRHFLYRENMSGKIVVFYLARTQSYFFRHEEIDDSLTLNGRNVLFNRIYFLDKGSALRCPKIQTIHFSDIIGNFLHMKVKLDVQLAALNIEYYFKNSENGISKLSFVGNSGQLIGIMGGSGVGKSTLLNILNGNLKPNSGRVLINGIDLYENTNTLKHTIGFIPQDDFLVEELTVYENLYFNARFCFSNYNEKETQNVIEKLLTDLDLFDIKDLKVGSPLNKYISGGQRKRLNIALELLREPSILFVDEPTSGLSSSDSEKVMELLKQQTFNGKLVIVNIHQPSSDIFKMFDRLLVLDKGGKAAYFGNTIESLSYFKNATQLLNAEESECIWCGNLNPEQILEIIESNKIDEHGHKTKERQIDSDGWYQLYLNNIDTNLIVEPYNKPLPKSNFKLPGKFAQFALYLLRNLKCKIQDRQYLLVNILEAPLLAVILGFLTKYSGGPNDTYLYNLNINIPAYIFMSIIVALFLGMMGSAEEIIMDAKLLKREAFLSLSKISYIHSKIFYLFLISGMQMMVFIILSHLILQIKGQIWAYWIILFSAACFANVLGLILSAGLKSLIAIYILIPLLLIPQLLLSGVIVKFDKLSNPLKSDIYVPVVGDIITSRWAYEAMVVDQFMNNRYEQNFYKLEKTESDATYCSNYWIPELLNNLDECQLALDKKNKEEILNNKLTLLKNEIDKLALFMRISHFKYLDSLYTSTFNEGIVKKTRNYLKHARDISSKLLKMATKEKDDLADIVKKKVRGQEALIRIKQQYHNESIADLVLNKDEQEKIVEIRDELHRKYEPIFITPERSDGRALFYSAFKKLANLEINTYWFNLMAIWLLTVILYFALLKNILGKAINFIESKNI